MICSKAETIQLFVDDELTAPARDEMAAHAAACAECATAVAEGLALKDMVRRAARVHAAPASLHLSVRRQLASSAPVARPMPWRTWAAAAAMLLAVIAVGRVWLTRPADPLLAELVDQHVVALSSANPVDVVSEDRHTVKPWFQGKLPFAFNLPELTGADLQLLGGKVTYLQQRPAAELLYQAGRHKVSVFVLQEAPGVGPLTRATTFRVQSWTSGGLQFAVVTDASEAEASRLVALLKAANQPQ